MALELAPAHLVGIGGAIGALLRHAVASTLDVDAFPLGTLVVNVLGSHVLALVTFAGGGEGSVLLVGVGGCGSFTTFSSFAVQTVRRWEAGEHGRAVLNAGANLVGALLAVGLGWVLVG